jgi:hypothetical protein
MSWIYRISKLNMTGCKTIVCTLVIKQKQALWFKHDQVTNTQVTNCQELFTCRIYSLAMVSIMSLWSYTIDFWNDIKRNLSLEPVDSFG